MRASEPSDPRIWQLLRDATGEQWRAARASATAARHEESASASATLGAHHAEMALLHRRTEARHRATAQLYRTYARRLQGSGDGPADTCEHATQAFVAALGSLAGAQSAVVSLGGDSGEPGVLVSGPVARTAQEWEYLLGEGPVHDCASSGALQVGAAQFGDRWPQYGAAVLDLGIRSVAAVPLSTRASNLGSLVVFDARPGALGRVDEAAEAFLQVLLGDPRPTSAREIISRIVLDVDYHLVVHQAAGVLAERSSGSVADALALLRARAFAEDSSLADLAQRVVDGGADELIQD